MSTTTTATPLTDSDVRDVYVAAMGFFATDRHALDVTRHSEQQFDQWMMAHDRAVIARYVAGLAADLNRMVPRA